jgi:hypothetical protein
LKELGFSGQKDCTMVLVLVLVLLVVLLVPLLLIRMFKGFRLGRSHTGRCYLEQNFKGNTDFLCASKTASYGAGARKLVVVVLLLLPRQIRSSVATRQNAGGERAGNAPVTRRRQSC